jgi:hypothetical protein
LAILESRAQNHRHYVIGQMFKGIACSYLHHMNIEKKRGSARSKNRNHAPRLLTALISRSLISAMQNKDLRWARPEYVFGSDEAEKPERTAKRKATKSEPFVDDGTLDTFTVAQIASMW